jgi:8-oxo-dGTP pyrophosphatase MutT (NUDIX family)
MGTRLRASVVCVDKGDLLCVRLRDPVSRIARLFAPGGGVEPPETAAEAAARETHEETGLEVSVDTTTELTAHYRYRWAGVDIDCETHFFRAQLQSDRTSPALVRDADYNEGVVWLPLDRLAELDFHAPIARAIRALLPELRDRGGTES